MHRSMMQVYVKRSDKALEFYQEAFDAKVMCAYPNDDGTYMHSELDVYGQIFAISEENPDTVTGNRMQFCLNFENGEKDKVTKAYDVLIEGAEKIDYPLGPCSYSPHMASLIDKFGVFWCIFTE